MFSLLRDVLRSIKGGAPASTSSIGVASPVATSSSVDVEGVGNGATAAEGGAAGGAVEASLAEASSLAVFDSAKESEPAYGARGSSLAW